MKALILGLALACCAVPAWAETQDDLTPEQLKAIAEEAARKAEKDTSDGWQDERVAVDLQVVEGDWLTVPFEQRFFDYSPARLKAEWPNLMRAMRVPYPDAEYLRKRFERFPVFREELGDDFDGDFEKLSANILEGWRLFFRGDFRAAKDHSVRYGAFGKLPGYLSQLIYAVYLCPSREEKLELLKDISNQVADYVEIIHDIKDDPEFSQDYLMLRLGYANAIARIAEEVTPANAIINNYFFKVKRAIDDVMDIDERHPVGLAFRAAMDANLIRVVGRFLGRVTFGARLGRVEDYFDRAIAEVPDLAIVHYEYANALIYVGRNRNIDRALDYFRSGMAIPPVSAMEALDAMYAAKRLNEIEDYLENDSSFRAYDKSRREYVSLTDENLYSILKPPFTLALSEAAKAND